MSALPPGVTTCIDLAGRSAIRTDLAAETAQGIALTATVVMTPDQAMAWAVQVIDQVHRIREAERAAPRLQLVGEDG
jgi:hypothetical protein